MIRAAVWTVFFSACAWAGAGLSADDQIAPTAIGRSAYTPPVPGGLTNFGTIILDAGDKDADGMLVGCNESLSA